MSSNDEVRTFLGLPVEGDKAYIRFRREYTPRPIEELYPYFKAAFDDGILAVTWHQYTPSFNDGEPCEFNVYDMSATKDPVVASEWLDGDFYGEHRYEVSEEEFKRETENARWYHGYLEEDGKYYRAAEEGAYDYIPGSSHPEGIKDVDIPINQLEFEDALRSKFGDGTQVVVSPERVVQFEYEHE